MSLIVMNLKQTFFYGSLYIVVAVLADQQELTDNISAWTHDVIWKTGQERWIIDTDEDKKSGKSVLPARLNNDDASLLYEN